MKYPLAFIFLLSVIFANSQNILKGTNVIKVTGVTFRHAAMNLLDAGFSFEKIDSNFQTVRTEWKNVQGYTPKIQLDIRVKDSTVIIKGTWQSMNLIFPIENIKSPSDRLAFKVMNNYALSFSKPIEYLINK